MARIGLRIATTSTLCSRFSPLSLPPIPETENSEKQFQEKDDFLAFYHNKLSNDPLKLIKHYFLCEKTLSETKAKLDKYYSDSIPSYGIVQKWFTEFRCGRTSTETIPSPVRPNEITTPKMINKIHDILLNVPKVKECKIAEIVSISTERVVNILHTHLYMRKLCTRWVPRLHKIDQKRIRSNNFRAKFGLF